MSETERHIQIMKQWERTTEAARRADIARIVENALIQKAHGDTYTLGMLWRVANMPMIDGVTTYQVELRRAIVEACNGEPGGN